MKWSMHNLPVRVWTVVLTAMLSGCSSGPVVQHHPAWPPPPTPPRIVHRLNLHGSDDVRKPGLLDNLDRLISGRSARTMLRPHAAAVDDKQQLYVTDQELQGLYIFDLKSGGSRFIDHFGDIYFVSPVGVTVCGPYVAVSDSGLNQVVLFTPEGKFVRVIAKPGEGFGRPTGLAYHKPTSELFVVDTLARQVCVFNLDGELLRSFGSAGVDVGQFNYPTHIFVSPDGLVYITDSLNFRVQAFDLQGKYLFDIGRHGDASGHLGMPKGVAVDSMRHIYVVDSYFGAVQIFDREGRFLLNFGSPGRDSGQFEIPTGITIDGNNRIYICDSYNGRVQVFDYVGGPDDEIQNDASP